MFETRMAASAPQVTVREESMGRLLLDLGSDRVLPLAKMRGTVRPIILAGELSTASLGVKNRFCLVPSLHRPQVLMRWRPSLQCISVAPQQANVRTQSSMHSFVTARYHFFISCRCHLIQVEMPSAACRLGIVRAQSNQRGGAVLPGAAGARRVPRPHSLWRGWRHRRRRARRGSKDPGVEKGICEAGRVGG